MNRGNGDFVAYVIVNYIALSENLSKYKIYVPSISKTKNMFIKLFYVGDLLYYYNCILSFELILF